MKKYIKKTISALLVGAMSVTFASSISAQENPITVDNETSHIDTYCESNNDLDFPINLDIDVMEDSIDFIKLDEPIYGFEYTLNSTNLNFNILASLKDDYKDFESYELKILNSDYSTEIFSESADKDTILTLSDLSAEETYRFNIKLNSDMTMCEFVGEFKVVVEIDNSLVIDLFYQNSRNEGTITTFISPSYESESNNTTNTANSLQNGVSMIGALTSSSDTDYFYYETPLSVPNGVVNLDISLSVPSGIVATMNVTCSTTNYNKTFKSTSTGAGIHHRITGATLGSKYYIRLTSSSPSAGKYYLTVSQTLGNAWYSQYTATVGSVDYWNPNKLETLKITYGTKTLPAYIRDGGLYDSWMGSSCGITSAAMVLRNLGKTMNGYDFRTNYKGQMIADPFTTMLANCKLDGTTMHTYDTSLTTTVEPSYFTYGNIADKFGVTVNWKGNGISCNSKAELKQLIDKYKYVMVYLNGSPTHWMVFTGYKAGDSSADESLGNFIVYDPAAKSYSGGAGVLLSNTNTGYKNKVFSDIRTVVVFS